MKKLLLVFLALAGTIQINAWHGRHGGWGHRGGWGWGWGRRGYMSPYLYNNGLPYYGPGFGPGYYSRPGVADVVLGTALTGAALAAATTDNERSPEHYRLKDKNIQRKELNKQIDEVKRDLKRNPGDSDLKDELKRLRVDLKNVNLQPV